MQQPNVVVELGTGAATTALMVGEALRGNGQGHIWTVDDGSAWQEDNVLRESCQEALGYQDHNEPYSKFMQRLLSTFELEKYISHVELHLGENDFFCPEARKIDLLFADATPVTPMGCASLLRYYLPKMAEYSSIFIDRASTIHPSLLLLNYFIEQLNHGRIPLDLLRGMGKEDTVWFRNLVARSSFSIVHLTETAAAKRSRTSQNSRAWIRIEPLDHVHHNNVVNQMYMGAHREETFGSS